MEIAEQVRSILTTYNPQAPRAVAGDLRALWLQFEPTSMEGIKAELREEQETAGTPIAVLRSIGREIARVARRRVEDFIPLTKLLWDDYGREGRAVALFPLGAMEVVDPETIVPLLWELCRSCVTWEDCDRLAMDALEPIVRKEPQQWLQALSAWLADENKWVRRAGAIVVGRLPLKHPAYAEQCLDMLEPLLFDEDGDVKKGVSFAIRLVARGEIAPVRDLLQRHVPPQNPAATWVLCDAIRSMTKAFLPELVSLLPRYEEWATDPSLSARDRRSVESAVKVLRSV